MHWAWRQWLSEPGRAGLSVLVYAGVLGLSLLFDGIRAGILHDLRQFPASLPADLVAIESGNTYFALFPSKLPQLARLDAEMVAGVADVQPIVLAPVIFDWNDWRSPTILLAFDRSGGPEHLAAGRAPTAEREVVLDQNLAHLHGIAVGDRVQILDYDLTVVGLSEGTSNPLMPYMFLTYDRLIDLFFEADLPVGMEDLSLVSALLITAQPGTKLSALRGALESALPDADLFTPAELGDADAGLGGRLFGPILTLISSIAWIITLLTMGLLRYADVQSHLREFGIQKALGATPRRLALTLAFGSVLLALSAFPLALLAARMLAWVTTLWSPLWTARVWDAEVLLRGMAAALIASVAGGLLPLRRLVALDPVLVFQR